MQKNILFFMSLLVSCEVPMVAKQMVATAPMRTIDHSITVFVHGTYPARTLLEYSFGKFLIYCPQGLSLAKNLPSHYHFHKMAQGCVACNPEQYCLDQFYVFGWKSEQIYDTVRIQAAADLVQQLQKIVDDYYQKYRIVPKIKLLGFSHGGNVVLHTANYLPLCVHDTQVQIEAWLFGTPVQGYNQKLVNSPYFKTVYSFYSTKDWMQRMDPQGLRSAKINIKNIWSERTFDVNHRCIQVAFTVNGKPISHVYYRSILKYFPIIERMAREQSQGMNSGFIAVDLKK